MGDTTIPLPPCIDLAAWQAAERDQSVMIVSGHDVRVVVRGGQLSITDGPPRQPRTRVIAKVPRTVDRLLILGGHGMLSVEAVRWLTWAGIPWSVLDTETCEPIAASGPRAGSARLLRSQALAASTPAALEIARLLLTAKLAGQADVIGRYLPAPDAAAFISRRRGDIAEGDNPAAFGSLEGRAADVYWQAWSGRVMVPFSPGDSLRVPSHWQHFTQRKSLSDRQPVNAEATDPVNAVLNYLYRIAETECVHACHAYGLSPALGVSHADKPGRDSMALDLMEVIRPACDSIALSLMAPDGVIPYADNRPAYTDRRWFTETREGTCRLVAPLTHQLAAHASDFGAIVMPYAREVAAILARHADGAVSVPVVAGVQPLTRNNRPSHSYPAARLIPGTRTNDVIPDAVWARIESLLPVPAKPKRGPHYSSSPREIAAALTIRYVMRCPWKDVPGNGVTVGRWLKTWEDSGTWAKAREVIEAHGHLAALTC